jgi:hypothetical protein
VDCEQHRRLCEQERVPHFPTLRLLEAGANGGVETYMAPLTDAEPVVEWALSLLHDRVVSISSAAAFRETVLRSDGHWLVAFSNSDPWCHPCAEIRMRLRQLASFLAGDTSQGLQHHTNNEGSGSGHGEQKLGMPVRIALVDCQQYGSPCEEQRISFYPVLKAFVGSAADKQRHNDGLGVALIIPQEILHNPPIVAMHMVAQMMQAFAPYLAAQPVALVSASLPSASTESDSAHELSSDAHADVAANGHVEQE